MPPVTGDRNNALAGVDAAQRRQAQLTAAVAAARDAYRHTTGLIRLLTVLSEPAPLTNLVNRTLDELSEVYSADVTCVLRRMESRLLVRASCGLPEDDPAFQQGWAADPVTVRRLCRPGRASTGRTSEPADAELPAPFAAIGADSAVWVPYGAGSELDGSDDVLVLCRYAAVPFTPIDVQVLRSVAYQLRLAVEASEYETGIRRLAAGRSFARQFDRTGLLGEAAVLLRDLTAANSAWVVVIEAAAEGLVANVAASTGRIQPVPPPRPAQSLPGWPTLTRGRPYLDNHPGSGMVTRGQALLGVPLMGESVPTTVLYSARDRVHPFHRGTVDLVTIFADQLRVALLNTELHQALMRSEASLQERATHDPLTGLATRVLAGQRLEEALAGRGDDHVGLLCCDLDLFKRINDRFGRQAGDLLLQQVATRLQGSVRPADVLARFNGDEFVVVLDGVRSLAEVIEIGLRLLRTLDEPFLVAGERVRITASAGGVVGARRRATAAAMLRDADAAMFVAKDRGPGQIEVLPTP